MLRKISIAVVALLALAAVVIVRPDIAADTVDTQYATQHSKFATLRDGTRMHYWDRGPKDAPPLVLIHGSYDCADTWELWAPQLERDFRLIVPDLPAHGLTGKTVVDDYSIGAMVASVHGLLQELGISRASLAGNSMGGNVSWRFALAHPEMVERLVLVDASGYPGRRDLVTPQGNNPVMSFLRRYGNPARYVREGLVKAVGEDHTALITDARVERSVAHLRRAGTRDAHRKRAAQRAADKEPFERIPEIKQPTLVMWGDKDALIPVEHAQRFARDLPSAKLVIYEGIDHMPQLENPERSVADAKAFLLAPAVDKPVDAAAQVVQPSAAPAP
jgi:pimeloyl-ACP methyl ester carboxylesterase